MIIDREFNFVPIWGRARVVLVSVEDVGACAVYVDRQMVPLYHSSDVLLLRAVQSCVCAMLSCVCVVWWFNIKGWTSSRVLVMEYEDQKRVGCAMFLSVWRMERG